MNAQGTSYDESGIAPNNAKKECCSKLLAALSQNKFLGGVNWVLFAVILVHWCLIGEKCGWDAANRDFALTDNEAYECIVFYGGLVFSTLVLFCLECLRCRGQVWRMRYAAGVIVLVVMSAGYITAYLWDGLNVTGNPSTTIRDVGLAIAAVLTLLFVIWRERIASNQAADSLTASRADRFEKGIKLLASGNSFERIGGIRLIRQLGEERGSSGERQLKYREASLNLLREWMDYRRSIGLSSNERRIAQQAIKNP